MAAEAEVEAKLHRTRKAPRRRVSRFSPGAGPAADTRTGGTASTPTTKTTTTTTPRSRLRRAKVLKMLAMEQSSASQGAPQAAGGRSAADQVEDFLTTGRTGRRNAMANIMGQHASTGSGDLSQRMEGLSTDQMEAGPSGAGCSSQPDPQPTPPGNAPAEGR